MAASLLDEVANLSIGDTWRGVSELLHCEVSSQVLRNLRPGTAEQLSLEEVNRRPSHLGSRVRDAERRYQSVLTVFGPLYSTPRSALRIMGYADVTSIYPDPVPMRVAPLTSARREVRARLSRFEASQQDILVVETDAMRARMREVLGSGCPQIEVVANTVNARVRDAAVDTRVAERLGLERRDTEVLLSYPTRAYSHKNLEYLPLVRECLSRRGVETRFVVTLTPREWGSQSATFRRACINLGEVTIDQVATVMRATDGVFFPSLLEAYSATPIEALALGVPLLASDRDFVRSTCRDAAIYFDPLDPESGADSVVESLSDRNSRVVRSAAGAALVAALPSAADRASTYLQLLSYAGRRVP